LLRRIVVVTAAEQHDAPHGDVGGEHGREAVVPLPRVHRHEPVIVGRDACFRQPGVEACQRGGIKLLGQQALVVESVDMAVAGMRTRHRHPQHRECRAAFRRVARIFAGIETDPATVGDKGWMPFRHAVFNALIVGKRKTAGILGAVVQFEGLRRDGTGDFFQIDRQHLCADAERAAEFEQEGLYLRLARLAVASVDDRCRIDEPVVENQPLGPEGVRGAAGLKHVVSRAQISRLDQSLVGEFGQRLGKYVAIGACPGDRLEMRRRHSGRRGMEDGSHARTFSTGVTASRRQKPSHARLSASSIWRS